MGLGAMGRICGHQRTASAFLGGARGGSHGRESPVVRKQSIAETVLEECQDGAVAGAPARPKTHNVCVCLT